MKCMLKNTNFTFVPLLNETMMVNPRKLIVWIITHSETAKKGRSPALWICSCSAMGANMWQTLHGVSQPRAATSGVPQLHRCTDSQTAAAEPMINALSGLWQQAGHHVLHVPSRFDGSDSSHSSSRAYSSAVYRNKNVGGCTLPVTVVTRPLSARTSSTSLRRIRIFCSSAHILLYLFAVYSAMTQGRQRKHWLRGFTPSASYKVSADRKDRKHYCTRVH